MNKNEYGGAVFNRTEDGKKELVFSDKENMSDIIDTLRENAACTEAEEIDRIRIVDYENGGITKKVIYSDHNKPQKKKTSGSIVFAVCVIAFIAAVAVFLCLAQ